MDGKKILVVDDDKDFLRAARFRLKSRGLNISGFIPKGGAGRETSVVMETFLRTLKQF